jgi:cysteine-S-conjugate beta-lyase
VPFDFDVIHDRHQTGSQKWDRYQGRDILPLWVADMDFRSPPAVTGALKNRIEHGIFGYTRPYASLTRTVITYLRERHGAEVDPDWIVWLPGLVPALSMACGSRGTQGDEIVAMTPVYPPFLAVHQDHERQLIRVPMQRSVTGRYELDLSALSQSMTERTRVLLFCNPHNPIGRVYTHEEMVAIAELCASHDVLLCSDEIHCDLIFDELRTPHISALALPRELQRRTITLLAASKTYNVAGLACAFAVVPDPTIRHGFRRAAGRLMAEISPLAFAATEAAYRDGEPWRQELLAYTRSSFALIRDGLADLAPHVVLAPSEATYLAWIDVRGLNLRDPVGHFESYGLGFSDGKDFGAPGFIRWNFGCPKPLLHEAIKRFRKGVEGAIP